MQKLGRVNPRLAEVVQCRYFAGYSEVEAAEALGMSERTLRREWVKARAWLYRELKSP
jgi:RNA polymerase sigma factor (sigma-70 family)